MEIGIRRHHAEYRESQGETPRGGLAHSGPLALWIEGPNSADPATDPLGGGPPTSSVFDDDPETCDFAYSARKLVLAARDVELQRVQILKIWKGLLCWPKLSKKEGLMSLSM